MQKLREADTLFLAVPCGCECQTSRSQEVFANEHTADLSSVLIRVELEESGQEARGCISLQVEEMHD